MKRPTTRTFQILGLLLGVAAAILSCIRVGMAMSEYQQRTGFDAGNGGVIGCFAVLLFPAMGWGLGGLLGSLVNRKDS